MATEGWPLGVALAAGSDRPPMAPASRAGALDAYLAEELLDPLEPHLRDAIVDSSIAAELDPSLVRALGLPEDLLEQVHRRGIPLSAAAFDEGRFAYHPLVRDLLAARLMRERSAARRAQLHAVVAEALQADAHGDRHELSQVRTQRSSIAPPMSVELEDVESLKDKVYAAFGEVAVLMNNAGTEGGGQTFGDLERWRAILETNLWGVINGVQVFAPAMIAQKSPCAIVNTGSKQGITTPPGNTAYNVSKAGVKVFTEALAHELRNTPDCQVTRASPHSGLRLYGLHQGKRRHRETCRCLGAGAGHRFPAAGSGAGDFYVLCPDNETTREMDEKRIRWAAEDIIENRPPLSRWHPGYKDAFAKVMEAGTPSVTSIRQPFGIMSKRSLTITLVPSACPMNDTLFSVARSKAGMTFTPAVPFPAM